MARLYAPFLFNVPASGSLNIPTTDWHSAVMVVNGGTGQTFTLSVNVGQNGYFAFNAFPLPAAGWQAALFARGLSFNSPATPAAGAALALFPLGSNITFNNTSASPLTVNYEAWLDTDG